MNTDDLQTGLCCLYMKLEPVLLIALSMVSQWKYCRKIRAQTIALPKLKLNKKLNGTTVARMNSCLKFRNELNWAKIMISRTVLSRSEVGVPKLEHALCMPELFRHA